MPSLLVTKFVVSPVSLLLRVTVTSGSTAPPADTVPRISPVFLLCENADAETNSRRHKASDQRTNLIMEFSTLEVDPVHRDGVLTQQDQVSQPYAISAKNRPRCEGD